MPTTIADLIEKIPAAFVSERAEGMDVVVQAHLDGEQGGDWYAVIRDQQIAVTPGVHANPNLSVRATAQDALDLYSGKLDPMRAFMQGKVHLQGNISLVMRLASMFRMP